MNATWQRGLIIGVMGWTLVMTGADSASANVKNFSTYKKAYPAAKAISCKLCHENAVGKGTDLNAYGKALQAFAGAGKAGSLTVEDFKAFETGDLDQDGVPNQTEIDAGSDPNDPASVPPVAGSAP